MIKAALRAGSLGLMAGLASCGSGRTTETDENAPQANEKELTARAAERSNLAKIVGVPYIPGFAVDGRPRGLWADRAPSILSEASARLAQGIAQVVNGTTAPGLFFYDQIRNAKPVWNGYSFEVRADALVTYSATGSRNAITYQRTENVALPNISDTDVSCPAGWLKHPTTPRCILHRDNVPAPSMQPAPHAVSNALYLHPAGALYVGPSTTIPMQRSGRRAFSLGDPTMPLAFEWTTFTNMHIGFSELARLEQGWYSTTGSQRTSRHNYQHALAVSKLRTSSGVVEAVYLLRAEGQIVPYMKVGDAFVPLAPTRDTLTQRADGGYDFEQTNGLVEAYSDYGRLEKITNRAGSALTFAYDDLHRLTSVIDGAGRALVYGYDAEHLLEAITTPGGSVFRISRSAPGNPVIDAVVDPAGNRCSPTVCTDPTGKSVAVSGTEEGEILRSDGLFVAGTPEWHTVTKTAGEISLTRRTHTGTTATPTRFTMKMFDGVARLVATDKACRGCPAKQEWNDDAELTSYTDWDNHKTCIVRDDRGLEIRRYEGLANTVECGTLTTPPAGARLVTTAWHPSLRRPTKIAGPKSIVEYTYNGLNASCGNSAHTALVCSEIVTRTFDETGALGFTAPADGSPAPTTYAYDVNGKLSSVDGPRVDVADRIRYEYYPMNDAQVSRRGLLSRVVDGTGRAWSITAYDANALPTAVRDFRGLVTTYRYDTRFSLVNQVEGTLTTTYGNDPAGRVNRVNLPTGGHYLIERTALDHLGKVTDASGNNTVYSRDGFHNVTKMEARSPLGTVEVTRTSGFDSSGRLESVPGANGRSTTLGYTPAGLLATILPPAMSPTTVTRDALDRLTRVNGPTGEAVFSPRGATDELASVRSPLGALTSFTSTGARFTEASPDSGHSELRYDAAGQLIEVKDADNNATTFTYDAAGRILFRTNKSGEITRFSHFLQSHSASNPSSSTSWQLNPNGSVSVRTLNIVQGPVVRRYETRYSYDKGLLWTIRHPSGFLVTYGRDAYGRITSVNTSRGQVLTGSRYNAEGALTSFDFANGERFARVFGPKGTLDELSLGADRFVVSRHDDGRVIGLFRVGSTDAELGVTFDQAGRLEFETTPLGTTRRAYDANGNVSRVELGSSRVRTYGYDRNRIVSWVERDTTTETVFGSGGVSYDGSGRAKSGPWGLFEYDADGFANAWKATATGPAVNFVTSVLGQRVRKFSGTTARDFHFDEGGRLIAETNEQGEGLVDYVWMNDLLVGVVRSDTDDDGVPDTRDNCLNVPNPSQGDENANRFGDACDGDFNGDAVVNAADALSLQSRLGRMGPNLWGDYTKDGIIDAADVAYLSANLVGKPMGPSGPVTPPPAATVAFVHTDHLGAPRVVTNSARVPVWRWDLRSAFGHNPADQDPDRNGVPFSLHIRMPGQYLDPELDGRALYNGARYYDPDAGRFLQADPIGLDGGSFSTYVYANNDPMNFIDPNGLAPTLGFYGPIVTLGELLGEVLDEAKDDMDQAIFDYVKATDPANWGKGWKVPDNEEAIRLTGNTFAGKIGVAGIYAAAGTRWTNTTGFQAFGQGGVTTAIGMGGVAYVNGDVAGIGAVGPSTFQLGNDPVIGDFFGTFIPGLGGFQIGENGVSVTASFGFKKLPHGLTATTGAGFMISGPTYRRSLGWIRLGVRSFAIHDTRGFAP